MPTVQTPVSQRSGALNRTQTRRLAVSGLFLIAACYGLARFAYGLYVPGFRHTFRLSPSLVGAIGSGSYAAYCAAILAATVLTARFGARPVAVTAGAVATVGTGMVAAAPTATVLACGVAVAGASTGLASPPLAQAVAQRAAEDRRDRVQTVINAGTGVGVAVSGPLALATPHQWRLAWSAFALLSAAATAWVARTVPVSQTAGSGHAALLPRPILASGAIRLLVAATAMGSASTAVWTFGRDRLATVGHLSATVTSVSWILLGLLGVLAAGTGDLLSRAGIHRSWQTGMLTLALVTVLVAAFPADPVVAVVAFALFGAVYIALTGILLVWGTRVYQSTPVIGVGLAFLMIAAGQAVSAPLLGKLTDALGGGIAFVIAAAIAVLGATLTTRPRTGNEPAG